MFAVDVTLMKALVFLLALILVDTILGICVSIRAGQPFSFRELPRFLQTEVLPYYLSLLALSFLSMLEDVQEYGTKPIAWVIVVAYGGKIVVEIKSKVIKLFGVNPEKGGAAGGNIPN
jgi:hypothetical protein